MKSLLLAISLALTGCASGPITFQMDPEFTTEQVALTYQAASTWNQYTNNKITVGLVGNSQIHMGGITENCPRLIGDDGCEKHISRDIYMKPGLDNQRFLSVMTHEMGHALGLEHIPEPALMDAIASVPVITTNDLNECYRVGAC